MKRATSWLFVLGMLLVRPVHAGLGDAAASSRSTSGTAATALPFAFDGPLPPIPPETVARDASGKVTIRAVRLTAPLRIDGNLDEAIYSTVPPVSDLIQSEPKEGAPATEKTEVWVTYDNDNVYVSFRCWETRPDRIVATEMRRDDTVIFAGDDNVLFQFDTFYDRRNSVVFITNSLGARMDGQVANERQYSGDWNPVYEVKSGKFAGGWTIETAVPFKSLRYRPGRAQIWGFNVRRFNRWKNEYSHITRIPAARTVGYQQASLAATLVGLEAPPGSKNLDIKPYVTSNLTTDVNAQPRISNDLTGDAGLDLKYGITQNLTADFTYNTDFAQVEADEQQINLTRFSLFFPEKREFFLENQGLFSFGGTTERNARGDVPLLFYSRRIGLEQGGAIPILGGGRLTGHVGRYGVRALNIQTDDEPKVNAGATNFSVLRLRRDILRRSNVGFIFTQRSVAQNGSGTNRVYGLDAIFAFFNNLAISTCWARTDTHGVSGKDGSYRAQLDYAGDRYGAQVERLVIGDNFNPQVGFVRRADMAKSYALLRFSPRPRSIRSVRKFSWTGTVNHVENSTGRLETRDLDGEFSIEFQNSDEVSVGYQSTYEFLPQPLILPAGISVPVGGYDYGNTRVAYAFGRQRRMSGNFSAEYGSFYDGHKTTVGVSRGRLNLTSQLSIEPTYSINRVELPKTSFTTHLLGSRVTYTVTPLMFLSALMQYNSSNHAAMTNVRLRWEYRPGSELFVVLNEQRDTQAVRFPRLANRAVIIKINRLFRL